MAADSAPPTMELVFSKPNAAYTQSHYESHKCRTVRDGTRMRGLRIVEAPDVLRHFTAKFAEV
jgi:tryptophanase